MRPDDHVCSDHLYAATLHLPQTLAGHVRLQCPQYFWTLTLNNTAEFLQ